MLHRQQEGRHHESNAGHGVLVRRKECRPEAVDTLHQCLHLRLGQPPLGRMKMAQKVPVEEVSQQADEPGSLWRGQALQCRGCRCAVPSRCA
eukprot:CAMPEP_0180479798 /NCGR_PEP_ID=MMETSP1036_2-20121128/33486_1 /TAXON_ID=632150 /ORGANISM="Azadinium spinosum, Strain 3D9" /LENGTH=91 /DNA_ID=CAMNT_0022487373 /DNA_START=375 /DNA_END=647 /DNA_ORIENTATION=-